MVEPKLYFIAVLPGSDLRDRVKALKEEMRDEYGPKHALKSPAHVTLQMPFKRMEHDEGALIAAMEKAAGKQKTFEVRVDGFGSFRPRVIYLNVKPHEPLRKLHGELIRELKTIGFQDNELSRKIHPHMTLATRDLEEDVFEEAWPKYRNRLFKATFHADSIWLLKHHGKGWDMYKEVRFV